MNNEVVKAMNRKPVSARKKAFHEWWIKNNYKVFRIILLPVWLILLATEQLIKWLDSKSDWNPKKADEILSYYVPRRADWDAEAKEFWLGYNSFGWNLSSAKKYLKLKDRWFWRNNTGWHGGVMRDYLIEKFELEGFNKSLGDCEDGWTEVVFKLIENGD